MEKQYSGDVDSRSSPPYDREELNDPPPQESLHRALQARQISMIAVRPCCVPTIAPLTPVEVGRSRRNWPNHWFGDCSRSRRSAWSAARLCVRSLFSGVSHRLNRRCRFMGVVCWSVMIALGEMSAYLPHKKGFAGYTSRYVDPALGFALSVNYLLKYLIVTPNKYVQTAHLLE
jgi:amino acid transporter